MRILYIPLEFRSWKGASHHAYSSTLGFEEGFAASGADFVTIPAIYETTSADASSWLHRARELCGEQHFDLAWVEIVHSRFDEPFLDWLCNVADRRVGMIWESCEMSAAEWRAHRRGAVRRHRNLRKNLRYMTHVIAVDERDSGLFGACGGLQACWLYDLGGYVPLRFIRPAAPVPTVKQVPFYGAVYGPRARFLADPSLTGLVYHPSRPPDDASDVPARFDALQQRVPEILSIPGDLRQRLRESGCRRHGCWPSSHLLGDPPAPANQGAIHRRSRYLALSTRRSLSSGAASPTDFGQSRAGD